MKGGAVSEREQGLTAENESRRRFLKQAGTVAWATPFIVTMMSRAAHAQAPCGTQSLNPVTSQLFCTVTTPCGSAQQCLPDPADPGPGTACLCQTVPNPG
jgi:hypothetical protein